jgi:hypothetical protein
MPPTGLPSSADALIVAPGLTELSPGVSENERPWVALLSLIACIATAGTAIYVEMGAMLAIPVVGAALVALVAWLGTSFRRPVESDRAIVLYIAGIVALMVEHAEQWRGRTPELVMKLAPGWAAPGFVFDERILIVVFAIASPALFLLGGFYLVRRLPIGAYLAWLLFIWSIVAGLLQVALAINRPHPWGVVTGIAAGVPPLIIGVLGVGMLVVSSRALPNIAMP